MLIGEGEEFIKQLLQLLYDKKGPVDTMIKMTFLISRW